MKHQKQITVLLTISVICIMSLNVYYLFFYKQTTKRPNPDNVGIIDDLNSTIGNEITIPIIEENIVNTKDNSYIRDIPILLDENMKIHLALFREKAKQLQNQYSDSFFISMPTQEKVVALTFDDGPNNSSTIKIMDILDEYKVPATFFFIGEKLSKFPNVVKAAVSGGHMVSNHSWSHLRPTEFSVREVINEIDKTDNSLYAFDITTRLFRPPYGLVTQDQMEKLNNYGYKVVTWSIDSMDWYFNDPKDIITCVVDAIHPGAIVLLHSDGGTSNREATIEALPEIIEAIRQLGYTFVTLEEL